MVGEAGRTRCTAIRTHLCERSVGLGEGVVVDVFEEPLSGSLDRSQELCVAACFGERLLGLAGGELGEWVVQNRAAALGPLEDEGGIAAFRCPLDEADGEGPHDVCRFDYDSSLCGHMS